MVKNIVGGVEELCAYVTPSVTVLETLCEGVLCASPDSADDEYDPLYGMGDI